LNRYRSWQRMGARLRIDATAPLCHSGYLYAPESSGGAPFDSLHRQQDRGFSPVTACTYKVSEATVFFQKTSKIKCTNDSEYHFLHDSSTFIPQFFDVLPKDGEIALWPSTNEWIPYMYWQLVNRTLLRLLNSILVVYYWFALIYNIKSVQIIVPKTLIILLVWRL